MPPKKNHVKKSNASDLFPDFLDLYKRTSIATLTAIKSARSEIAALGVRVNELEKSFCDWRQHDAKMHAENKIKDDAISEAIDSANDDVNKIHNTLKDVLRLYDKTVMPLANAVSNLAAK